MAIERREKNLNLVGDLSILECWLSAKSCSSYFGGWAELMEEFVIIIAPLCDIFPNAHPIEDD